MNYQMPLPVHLVCFEAGGMERNLLILEEEETLQEKPILPLPKLKIIVNEEKIPKVEGYRTEVNLKQHTLGR